MVKLTTASSVWTFDPDAKTYTRSPLVGGNAHPFVPYDDGTIAYAEATLDSVGVGGHVFVVHPDGSTVRSGRVVEVDRS